MVIDIKQQLLSDAADFCAKTGLSKARLATIVVNDGKFFARLERGGGFTAATYEKFMAYFRAHAEGA